MKSSPQEIFTKLSQKTHLKKILLPCLQKDNPEIEKITEISAHPVKKHHGQTYSHLVAFHKITLEFKNGKTEKLKLISVYRSDKKNKKIFNYLKYFSKKAPLTEAFYFINRFVFIDELNTLFYYFINGKNLYSRMEQGRRCLKDLNRAMKMAGKWLALFHKITPPKNLPKKLTWKFIDPVNILKEDVPIILEHKKEIHYIYRKTQKYKKTFTINTSDLVLTHGDFHFENMILQKSNNQYKLAVIDFYDLRIESFTLDLAFFYMQLSFMGKYFIDEKEISKLQNKFLRSYLKERNISLNKNQKKQFNYFKAIISLRSAIFFLSINQEGDYLDAIELAHENIKTQEH